MSESRTITVAVDPNLHTREPVDEVERLTWAALDTAWNLLRDTAVQANLAALREANPGLPSDEELFKEARESGIEGAPTSYRDLAPNPQEAVVGFSLAFELLAATALDEMIEGLGLLDDEASESNEGFSE